MKRISTLVVGAAAVLVAGAAFSAELRFGVKVETPSVDPHWSTNTSAIAVGRHAFDHLIAKDELMGLEPQLAESWKPIDDLTWELKLRKGVKFHDGTPFTADDVLFSFDRATNIETPTSFKQYLADKKGEKIDDYTVLVRTSTPNPLMETDLAAFAIVSKKHGEGASTADFNSGKATIGTGPYKFVEWKREDQLVFEANGDYWGPKAAWDKVTYKPIKSNPTRVAALKSGDVDIIDQVPTTDIPSLKKDPKVVISAGTGNRPFYMWLDSRRDLSPYVWNNDGSPAWPNPLRDWKVRKALSRAINRQGIVDRVFEGSATVGTQLLPEGFYGYNEDLLPEPYEPDTAKKLLAEAGYPDGFKVTLHSTTGGYLNDVKVTESIAQMWTQVGVKTEVVLNPKQVFFSKITGAMNNSAAVRTYSVASGEPSIQLKAVVHTGPIKGTVYCCQPTGMSNPRSDAAIEEAIVTIDRDKREKLFKEAIGIAVNDYGILPIYFEVYTWASRPGIKYIPRLDGFSMAIDVVATN